MSRLLMIGTLLVLGGCQGMSTGSIRLSEGTVPAEDDVTIAYDVRGRGKVALVFVHCWSCDRAFWREQVDEFADDYRVVTIDLPGHGESGRDRTDWTITGLGADVAKVVKQLRLHRVVLVGHSMGGPVSLEAARLLRGRVLGIVAVDTMHSAEMEIPKNAAERWAAGFEADFEGMMARMVRGMFPGETAEGVVDWVIRHACASDRTAVLALMRDFSNLDLPAMFSAAQTPIRAINATKPTPTAGDTNRKYANYEYVLMDDVGHFIMLQRPDEFNAHLREVLAELSAMN